MEKILNALLVFCLALILCAALVLQFFFKEVPCPLCYLQRLGMMGVASGALMNLKFGIRRRHYALSLLSCLFGGFVALRQIALHICPGFPTFGVPFWGISLYTWSFFIFASSVAYIALLFLIFDAPEEKKEPQKLDLWGWIVFSLMTAVVAINILALFRQCGIGPCG